MKKIYELPCMSILCYESEDVITGSSLQTDAYNSITSEDGSLKVDGKNLSEGQVAVLQFQ